MDPLAKHFRSMAYNNAWSSYRLLTACEALDREAFHETRTSFFPSLWKTLNHIVTVDWFYVDALERAIRGEEPHPDPYSFFTPEEPFDTAAALHAGDRRQRRVEYRLQGLVPHPGSAAD